MSSLSELRAAAEPYKSFPNAVAALIRAAFDRGASKVEVSIRRCDDKSHLFVSDDGKKLTEAQQAALVSLNEAANHQFPSNIGLGVVHHAGGLCVQVGDQMMATRVHEGGVERKDFRVSSSVHVGIGFLDLGEGDGVNPKQNRSAKRLVRELPHHLSPREALHTVVIDENGKRYELAEGLPGTTVDGSKIDWPESLIGYSSEGMTLKFGAVRVPMTTFLGRLSLTTHERERLSVLIHPWVRGILELRPDSEFVDIPVPTESADDFDEDFYDSANPGKLVQTFIQIVPAIVVREMNKLVMDYIRNFAETGVFCLRGQEYHEYRIACADLVEVRNSGGRLLWEGSNSTNVETQLLLDVTHPVFRTVDFHAREVMQVIWWQLAMWIAHNQPDVLADEHDPQMRCARIYLALREQNPDSTLLN